MQKLRIILRFWFGIQAVLATVALLSFCLIAVAFETGHAIPGINLDAINHGAFMKSIVTGILLMTAADSISGMAWWKIKKDTPHARQWAIAASLLNLPLPLLSSLRASTVATSFLHLPPYMVGTVIGVAGLSAFWSKDSTTSAKRARATATVRDFYAQGISIGILLLTFHWWNNWATHRHLLNPGVISYVVQFQLATWLTTFAHELGHLAAGWASRKVLYSFRVGPFSWAIRNGEWRFDFNLRNFNGGAVGMVSPSLANIRSREAFCLLGGPVGSLVMGSICVTATMLAPGHAWAPAWTLLSMMASLSIIAFVVNLIPQRTETTDSDGAHLYQVLTNGPGAYVIRAFAMVNTNLLTRARPQDFDIDVLKRAAEALPRGPRGLLLRLFACKHHLDKGQIREAIAIMDAAELLYEQASVANPADICADIVFVNALHKRDLTAADFWWSRLEAAKGEKDANYWKARAALLQLKGKEEEACQALERGASLASILMATGAYTGSSSCFAELR